ncbi:MAG: RDD family protein [candidate division Zixibacteria bacterium]|nr:RDD family protein [candidate division Zixibacteria bacterium]
MWVCTHCHENIEDSASNCWNCGHPREGKTSADWSRQFQIQKEETELNDETKPRSFNWTRQKAFLIDYIPFLVLWGVIDNIVYLPVSEKIMEIASVVLFCAYFVAIEGLCTPRASWGKRKQGLILVSRTGDEPGVWTVVLRSLIVASLIIADWSALLNRWPVPVFMQILSTTIPIGIIQYNLWLAARSEGGLMLQDRLTGTQVVWAASVECERPADSINLLSRPDIFPKPWNAVGFIAGTSLIGLLFSLYINYQMDSASLWQIEDTTTADVSTVLEREVADELGIRCVVGLTNRVVWSWKGSRDDSEVERWLIVEVWVPAILWNDETLAKVRKVVLDCLTVEPGFYDGGKFKTTTGFSLFEWSRGTSLTMP